jgi:putative colanic acid biosynthesis acetyltransferase WcaF
LRELTKIAYFSFYPHIISKLIEFSTLLNFSKATNILVCDLMNSNDLISPNTSNPKEGGASFSFLNRVIRAIWIVVWFIFCRWTPTYFFGWRRLFLSFFGAQISKSARVYSSVNIWLPKNVTMEEHSCLGPEVNCYSMGHIHIGAYATVSQRAVLCAGTHDIDNSDFQLVVKPIIIGSEAWVAAEAFVGPGVTIAPNSVIGARCVIFCDTVTNGVYAGNPAKFIRYRNI